MLESSFPGRDGVNLGYREVGDGRPLVLLHGLAGNGTLWTRHGRADALAARGHRVILPDFRGHGASAKPHDPAAYPPDVLADDGLALIDHLGLSDYDLGGYSLGARIAFRMLVRGATPGRAIVAGQGLRELLGTGGGAGARLRRAVEGTGEPDGFARWLATSGEDPVALLHALDSVVATPREDVTRVRTPTLVVLGADDERAASGDELAVVLPDAVRVTVPGDHGTAVDAPELLDAILSFVSARPGTTPAGTR
ncbi:alpha/beta fold hydrolase [Cryptosporangium phraense]|uniref:Alpha/beta hydrolase n=1 Tax=Cryptosporangium phraense TaxID=2593070 RepID=A0A545AEK4_9ACTN|nr:alpha/beta hydrolase [Cryptosporangium phraense]TQS39767.1 alpha/beta hydrolase [Cryptosporangium phraense]